MTINYSKLNEALEKQWRLVQVHGYSTLDIAKVCGEEMKTIKVTVEQLQDIQQQLEDSIAHCRKMGKTLQATEKELEQAERERDELIRDIDRCMKAVSGEATNAEQAEQENEVLREQNIAINKTCVEAEQKLARAMEILADDELSDSTATKCNDPKHDPRWCPTCNARADAIYDYREAIQKELGEE